MKAFSILFALCFLCLVQCGPCVNGAVTTLNTEQYLCLMRKAEETSGVDRATFITGLRKVYYGDGVSGVNGKTTLLVRIFGKDMWDLVIPSRKRLPVLTFKDAEASQYLRQKYQEITGPTGEPIDIGHVIAGLDSCSYPATSLPFRFAFGLKSGPAISTWGGDVGSAVAEWTTKGKKESWDKVYGEMASVADMNGNADSYAIYGSMIKTTKPLWSVLNDYYAGGSNSLCTQSRWSAFFSVAGISFRSTKGTRGKVTDFSQLRESISKNSKALAVQQGGGIRGKISNFARPPFSNADVELAVGRMVGDAERDMARENWEAVKQKFVPMSCARFD